MMPKPFLLALVLLFAAWLCAQEAEPIQPSIGDLQIQLQAMSDSLLQYREQEIYSDFGFRDTDRLEVVATKLKIGKLDEWKSYLGVEPRNPVLDKMSLRRLGITPYRALLAQQYSIYGYTELSTLSELANRKHLPIKKLRQFAGIKSTDKASDNSSLQALGLDPAAMLEFEKDFADNRIRYGFTIAGIGILIVFSALAITALVIGQLKHINRTRKPRQPALVLSSQGKVISHPSDLNSDIIAAAITALHLYKQSIEDRRRLHLTFRRQHSGQWRGSAALNMPNRNVPRHRS